MIEKFTDLPLLQGFGDLFTKQIGRKRKFQFQNQNKVARLGIGGQNFLTFAQ